MRRSIIATVMFVLAIEVIIVTVLLFFTPTGTKVLSALSATPTPTPAPILTARGNPPLIHAGAIYLMDTDTGHVLDNSNGQKHLPIASTTKIMTALLTIETANLNQIVTIHQDALDEVNNNGGSSANLAAGDQVRLKDLLYALMLPSGDDAAIAIADAVSGSSTNFVKAMNNYAHKLNLKQTHYINPDGLTYYIGADGKPDPHGKPDPTEYSTAADLAHLSRVAMQNPLFAQIVQLQEYDLPKTATHQGYVWKTIDTLLSGYPGALGVKTGHTIEAGYCLVFSATNAGHHLIGVLLQENDITQRFTDAQTLLDWGFALPLLPPTSTP